MKILITGASGFIGFRLAKKLIENGSEAVCLVRKVSPEEKVRELSRSGAELYYGDITDESSLGTLPSDIDGVYHLAALLDHSITSYEPYHRINVGGTRSLVEHFLDSGLKKFVFTSSISAIGLVKTKSGLITESVKCSPTTLYGRSKYEAENLLFRYSSDSGFPVLVLRPPTVYGPGGKNGFLETAKFIRRKIERKLPIFYIGGGDVLTSFCYVNNLVNALVLAMDSNHVGELFHIDDGRPYTNKEVLDTISRALGDKPPEIYVPKVFFNMLAQTSEFLDKTLGVNIRGLSSEKLDALSTSMAFDISKARKQLGYTPSNNFKESVRETIEWYKRNNLL